MSEHEQFVDSAGAFVLGALPDDERRAFVAHMQGCADCQAEVQELRMAAEALPVSAPAMRPPPALKARIMAEVEREAALLESAREPRREPAEPRRRWRLSWPTGAVAALACATLLAGVVAGAFLFGSEGTTTVPFQADASIQQASAELEMTGDAAIVTASNLPAPPQGRVYMVWLKHRGAAAPQPTSALFTPRADGSATASVTGDMSDVESVIVNTEEPPGADAPTSPPLLTATLT